MSPRAERASIQRTVHVHGSDPSERSTKRGFDWSEVVEPLVKNPGQWFRVDGAPPITAKAIMRGPVRPPSEPFAFRPAGAFEAQRSDGALFIRYVGTPMAAWAPDMGDAREFRHLWRLAPVPIRWLAYSSPDRLLGLSATGETLRAPRIDPSSPPPDATTATKCSICTWRPARGTASVHGTEYAVCGVEPGHPPGFTPYDPLPSSQVHGEPEGPAPDEGSRVVVEPADPPTEERVPVIDGKDYEGVRAVLDANPGEWHRIPALPATYSTRINRGRIAALRGVQARSRRGSLELRVPKED